MPDRSAIALAPEGTRSWLGEAVEAGGATIVEAGEADGLVWTDPADPAGLGALLDAHPQIDWVQLPWAGIEPYVDVVRAHAERTWTCGKGVYAEPVAEHALALALAGLRHVGPYAERARVGPAGGHQPARRPGRDPRRRRDHREPAAAARPVRLRRHRRAAHAGADGRRRPGGRRGRARRRAHAARGSSCSPSPSRRRRPASSTGAGSSCSHPDGWVVNVARGAHIVTDDLVAVLAEGRIGGAGLDVTDPEPLPDGHPLWDEPRCLITPAHRQHLRDGHPAAHRAGARERPAPARRRAAARPGRSRSGLLITRPTVRGMDFRTTTVAALADDVSAKRISARELVGAALARIEEVDAKINAFVALDGERALADAAAVDARLAAGEDVGPLAGIPIGVKDLEDAAGFRTTQGSAVYADSPIADDRLAARRAAEGGRLHRRRQDQHPRGRPQGRHRQPALRRHRQPVGPHPQRRRLVGRFGGRHRRRARAAVHRLRRRRLDPHPVVGLRHLGHEAVARPGADRRARSRRAGRTCRPAARWRAKVRDITLALDAVVGPDATDLRSLPMPDTSWSRSLHELHAPRKVGWSPTLGYATVDGEVLALCEAALQGPRGPGHRDRRRRPGVRRGPGHAVAHARHGRRRALARPPARHRRLGAARPGPRRS